MLLLEIKWRFLELVATWSPRGHPSAARPRRPNRHIISIYIRTTIMLLWVDRTLTAAYLSHSLLEVRIGLAISQLLNSTSLYLSEAIYCVPISSVPSGERQDVLFQPTQLSPSSIYYATSGVFKSRVDPNGDTREHSRVCVSTPILLCYEYCWLRQHRTFFSNKVCSLNLVISSRTCLTNY
jgi:hypothetical protein